MNDSTDTTADRLRKAAAFERERAAARRDADRTDWIGNDPPDRE